MSGKVQVQGVLVDWSDEELERLAAITPAVIADAKADARRLPNLHTLLSARQT